MDYYEGAQIGGYKINMPFPQLFYPELNSNYKSYDPYSEMNNRQYHNGADDEFSPHGPSGDYKPQCYGSGSSSEYRAMERWNQMNRQRQARNGLYAPEHSWDKRNEYDQYSRGFNSSDYSTEGMSSFNGCVPF